MAGEIEFTSNYSDLSTDNGFQFEFRCDRCGNGFRTEFDTFELSTATDVLDGAGSLLGGVLRPGGRRGAAGQVGRLGEGQRQGLQEGRGADAPEFVQCPRCSAWVCREQCWNDKKGLCKQCAPDLGVEMAAAQADSPWRRCGRTPRWRRKTSTSPRRTGARASWPPAPSAGRRRRPTPSSAPECGADLKAGSTARSAAPSCSPGAKFCADCGAQAGLSLLRAVKAACSVPLDAKQRNRRLGRDIVPYA